MKSLRVDEFDYQLPEDLIAQNPLEKRDSSRLMVVDRSTGTISHRTFSDIVEYVSPGDVLVLNYTRVIPARVMCRRKTGGRVEVLLLRDLGDDKWECLVRPGHKVRIGEVLYAGHSTEESPELVGTVLSRTEFGGRVIQWKYTSSWEEALARFGQIPLPPYIKTPLKEPDRYQTVYARVPGSAAAPTAGLHFTVDLLDSIRAKGCNIVTITLNVGIGTFRPVREEIVEAHRMHEEFFTVSRDAALTINSSRQKGGKLMAVGTTVVRTLESAADESGMVRECQGSTDLFIYPGYRFKVVDALITNFHLPRSTLLMLVCAFGGRDLIMKAYAEAVARRYRFFSFGDAMLIL